MERIAIVILVLLAIAAIVIGYMRLAPGVTAVWLPWPQVQPLSLSV